MPIVVTIPLKIPSPNVTEHWTKKHKRTKQHNLVLGSYLKTLAKAVSLPCSVTLTRIGKKTCDWDNAVYSLKGVRDFIAGWLIPGLAAGRADGDDRITWHYKQEIAKEYGLRIEIEDGIPF